MKPIRYIVLILIFLLCANCQKEEHTIIQEEQQSFLKNSPIVNLLSRTSQNPTAEDNVLDNSSLIRIQLPVTVIVNGNTITVSTPADYQLVQNAIEAIPTDDDVVHFVYPIIIQLQNYSTQDIKSDAQLQAAIAACGADDHLDEIDCIALVYPITINTYDSTNQVAGSVTITSNAGLFNFLASLTANIYAAISYPIAVVNSNGQTVVINSNIELMNLIENSIEACNTNSGGAPLADLSQVLINGDWLITYCLYDGNNETSQYQGFHFDFNNNETIDVQTGSGSIDGDWDINSENGYQRLSLNFDGSLLHDIETNWRVIEYTETIIKLKKQNSDYTDYLTFTKN